MKNSQRKRATRLYLLFSLLALCIGAALVSQAQKSDPSVDLSPKNRPGNPFDPHPVAARQAEMGAGQHGKEPVSIVQRTPSPAVKSKPAGKQSAKLKDATTTTTDADSIVTANDGKRPDSPNVGARIRQETAFLPAWINQLRRATPPATLVVKPGSSGKAQFATLNQALENVPADGAKIKLSGAGPFPLYPAKISDKTKIVIEPQEPSPTPALVVLLLPEDATESNFVEITNTMLELRGIQLALDGDGLSTAPDDALLSAVSSDVFLHDCIVSVRGMPESPMTALKISDPGNRSDGKDARQCRVLIENSIFRGNRLTALTINAADVDLALWNSLAWSGTATALRFGPNTQSDPTSAGSPTAQSDPDAARKVRLVSTTVCSLNCAVEIAGDASQPVPTSIESMNSLVASPRGSKTSALLNMQGWNQNQQEAALGRSITWTSTDSLYTGWDALIQRNPGAQAAATTASDWRAAWHDKGLRDTASIQEINWPGRSIDDICAVGTEELTPQTVGTQFIATGEGGWPGCQTERLPAVSRLDSLAVVPPVATHPLLPQGLFQSDARQEIRVDVTREDLGKFIARQTLQNGTVIIASGTGLQQTSPIVVENAWVRLQFESTGAAPLVMIPRPGKTRHDGFITVINGGIEIVGGAFVPRASDQQSLPKWFIQSIDSDLAMWRCRVQYPFAGAASDQGLIQWQAISGRAPVRPFEGSYRGYAWFDSCYLAGPGRTIDADMSQRALAFKNCIVASGDDLFSLDIGPPDPQIGGVVDLSYSTLTAAKHFFHVFGSTQRRPTNARLKVFADRCVFAPPLPSARHAADPSLLTYERTVIDRQQFTWCEQSCAYSTEIAGFFRDASEKRAAPPQELEYAWKQRWGIEQVVDPLFADDGVMLKTDFPTKAKEQSELEPFDFQLDPDCGAATWDADGPIGAHIGAMHVPPLRAAAITVEKRRPTIIRFPTSGSNPPDN